MNKNIVIIVLVLLLIGVIGYFFLIRGDEVTVNVDSDREPVEEQRDVSRDDEMDDAESDDEMKDEPETVIGESASGRALTAFHYGTGDIEVMFIGGIHGGYSWNTSLVAFELMDYLEENPGVIPENVKVTVVPVMNPDGLSEVVGTDGRFARADAPTVESVRIPGRFNANNVDLNRNFDCVWRSSGIWRDTTVDAGEEPFSEPEARAIRNYVKENEPDAVVAYYSAAGGVFSSSCNDGVLPETRTITNVYADASGYPAFEEFDFYEITGDMVNWLASGNVPAISVLLTNHTDLELEKNLAGIEALLRHYAN